MRPPSRLGAVVAAALITVIVVAVAARPWSPPGLRAVSIASRPPSATSNPAVGYNARNTTSGAYGKYQIMPSNWPAWARQLPRERPRRSRRPHNQERVASGKMTSLYRWLGSWRRVAYWWLTGSEKRSSWSPAARRYVDRVMALYRHGTPRAHPRTGSTTRIVNDRSRSIVYAGSWHAGAPRRLPQRHRPLLDVARRERDA